MATSTTATKGRAFLAENYERYRLQLAYSEDNIPILSLCSVRQEGKGQVFSHVATLNLNGIFEQVADALRLSAIDDGNQTETETQAVEAETHRNTAESARDAVKGFLSKPNSKYTLRLDRDAENMPALVLCEGKGEADIDMSDVYEQCTYFIKQRERQRLIERHRMWGLDVMPLELVGTDE